MILRFMVEYKKPEFLSKVHAEQIVHRYQGLYFPTQIS